MSTLYICLNKDKRSWVKPVAEWLYGLANAVLKIGINDPPKSACSSSKELIDLITRDAGESTIWTFGSYGKNKGFTIELHNDPRWEFDTMSVDCPGMGMCNLDLNGESSGLIFAVYQDKKTIYMASCCPEVLKQKLPDAEPGAQPDAFDAG